MGWGEVGILTMGGRWIPSRRVRRNSPHPTPLEGFEENKFSFRRAPQGHYQGFLGDPTPSQIESDFYYFLDLLFCGCFIYLLTFLYFLYIYIFFFVLYIYIYIAIYIYTHTYIYIYICMYILIYPSWRGHRREDMIKIFQRNLGDVHKFSLALVFLCIMGGHDRGTGGNMLNLL